MLKLYLKEHIPAFILFAVCCAVFALSFRLYGLPLSAVAYPAIICFIILITFIVMRFFRFNRKHRILRSLSEALTEDMLPPAENADDMDYRRIILLIREAAQANELAGVKRYSDMIEYYTLWAHQIKTPIAAMRLTLQNEDTQLSRRLKSDLGRVERYVDMVLAYLRLDSSSTDYVLREFELDPLIRSCVKRFSGEFIDRKLSMNFTPTKLRILSDEKWLSFVLEQLLSNALKYTPEGGITIFAEEPETLCISDTGIGIAPEDLPRIFEQGFTGYNGRRDKHASGLGLYLCRRVLKQLGHVIRVESEPGKGTVMRISFSRKK
ncbi:MAG: sensor histidine kinase [Lachnospiraceae bacterium]|nr:sensor histidine kinase [Lachnospiraceae bacterium]